MKKKLFLVAAAAAIAFVLGMSTSSQATQISWDFDSDPGLIRQQMGPGNPGFQHSIDGGILSVAMTREAAKERLFVFLPGGPFGADDDVFRLRTRYRTTNADFAQVGLGFYNGARPNSNGGSADLVQIDWSSTLTGTGDVGSDRERSGFRHEADTWYVSELVADFGAGTWDMNLYHGSNGTTLLAALPGAPRDFGTHETPRTPLDILSFANEDCCQSSSVFTMDFDWVTAAVNMDLPDDPAYIPEPTTLALVGLGAILGLTQRRRTTQR